MLHVSHRFHNLGQCADRLFIATFHRVLPNPQRDDYPFQSLVVSPKELEWFIQFFIKNFDCQRLDVACKDFFLGQRAPRPRLAITFDDGQLDNFLYAAPVLQRIGVPATFFIPTEAIERQTLLWHDRMAYTIRSLGKSDPLSMLLAEFGIAGKDAFLNPRRAVVEAKKWTQSQRMDWLRRAEVIVPNCFPKWDGMMTWDQVRKLARQGHEIGSHSHSHLLLDQCNEKELETEIQGSRLMLEQNISGKVTSFCYPNGNSNQKVRMAVAKAGYSIAVTTSWGSNCLDANPFTLMRHDMVAANSVDQHGRLWGRRVEQRMLGLTRGAS